MELLKLINLISLTKDDDGKTIKACIGDKVSIRLQTNPSTGFMWMQGDTTAGMLDEIIYDPILPNAPMGASTFVTFTFKITSAGDIHLFYARSFEPTTPAQQWFKVMVACNTT